MSGAQAPGREALRAGTRGAAKALASPFSDLVAPLIGAASRKANSYCVAAASSARCWPSEARRRCDRRPSRVAASQQGTPPRLRRSNCKQGVSLLPHRCRARYADEQSQKNETLRQSKAEEANRPTATCPRTRMIWEAPTRTSAPCSEARTRRPRGRASTRN